MSNSEEQRAIAFYTQLFAEVANESGTEASLQAITGEYEFNDICRGIYTTPLSLAAFKNKLQNTNTELGTATAKRLFRYGVKLLVEVTLFGVAKKPIENLKKNINGKSTVVPILDDDEDGDITAQRGRPSTDMRRKSTSGISKNGDSTFEEDGDDLTTLRGPVADSEFATIDDELRFQLVCNIIRIVQCYFVYLDGNFFDFWDNEEDRDALIRLLKNCEFYLHKMVEDIESSDSKSFLNLSVVKELIYLVFFIIITYLYEYVQFLKLDEISRPQSVSGNDVGDELESEDDDQNEESIEFLFLFNLFPPLINRILSITDEKPPKLTLLLKTLSKMYSINTFTDYLTKTKRHLFRGAIPYKMNFESQIPYKLIPIMLMDFSYYYAYQLDLMLHHLSSKSFFHWLTGNRFSGNAYLNYQTAEYTTSLYENLDLSLFGDFNKDSFLKELQAIHNRRLRRDELADPKELIAIFLMLYLEPETLMKYKSETLELPKRIDQDDSIDLLDLWLCLSSYIVQYHHKSQFLQLLTRVFLATLHKLFKNYDKFCELPINEAKWKLCHQKAPIVPLNKSNTWITTVGKYVCDILQIMVRFNLNNKMNVENYRLALDLVYKLIITDNITSDSYSFVEIGRSIFMVLDFVSKKHNSVIRYAVLEDLLLNLDLLLWKSRFEDAHLLYEFLHKKLILVALMTESDVSPPHIKSLLEFLDRNVKLEEIVDEAEAEDLIVKLVDGDSELTNSVQAALNYNYKFKDTCMYVNGEISELEIMGEVLEYLNTIKNID